MKALALALVLSACVEHHGESMAARELMLETHGSGAVCESDPRSHLTRCAMAGRLYICISDDIRWACGLATGSSACEASP